MGALSSKGYRVVTADWDRTVVELPIAVAIVEVQPTVPAELEIVSQIKARTPDTHIILITSCVEQDWHAGALNRDVYAYLHAPSDPDQLLLLVERAVEDRQTRLALRDSELRFRATFEQAAVGIAHTGPEGCYLRVNERFCRMVGYTQEELLSMSFEAVTHPDDVAGNLALAKELWGGIRRSFTMEKRFRCKDGSDIWANLTAAGVYGQDGSIEYTIAVVEDISQRKKAEAEKDKIQDQLLQAQKMQAVGHLTAGIAHDFNNLLTAINGYTEMMQLQMNPNDPLYSHTEKILSAGERAAALINQLMVFSRKKVVEPQTLYLNRVIRELNSMLQRIIGEDIVLQLSLASELWPTLLDPSNSQQIIVNLAVNARDAMPQGGTLEIQTSNISFSEAHTTRLVRIQPGDYVCLAVVDNGTGIGSEILEHVFEPFFTTKSPGQGTGLGLATVYGIVEQASGFIDVQSCEGEGTTVLVYLPRTVSDEPTAPPVALRDPLPLGCETVLIVEDNPAVRELTGATLARLGYHVLTATTAGNALDVFAHHTDSIDLLLTDVILPGVNGVELAQQLVAAHPHLKVLFLSGYSQDVLARYGDVGATGALLQKPVRPVRLARMVREVLDERASSQ